MLNFNSMEQAEISNYFDKLKIELKSYKSFHDEFVSSFHTKLETDTAELNSFWESLNELSQKKTQLEEQITGNEQKKKNLETKKESQLKQQMEIQENINTLKQHSESLNKEKGELSHEVEKLKDHYGTTKVKYDNLEKNLQAADEALIQAENEHKNRVKDIVKERDQLKSEISKKQMQFKVLQKLLKDSYIKDSTYDVLKALSESNMSNLGQLALSSGVSKDNVNKILMSLHEKGIISYEKPSGNFEIKKEIRL